MSEHQLSKETAAARVLKAALLEVTDDPDALADTIEGATNLHEAIAAVMDGIGEDEMLCAGLSSMMQAMAHRKARLDSRIDRRRVAIERAMAAGELTKMELPQATLSVRRVPPKLEIVSEDMVPREFFQPQPEKLDKLALAAALKAGIEVPGARLSNGSITLSIRRA